MAVNRALHLAIFAVVLVVASYTARYGIPMSLAVLVMSLIAVRFRPVLGIPASIVMAAAAALSPALAGVVVFLAVVLASLSGFVNTLLGWGGAPESDGVSGSDIANTLW
jgi:hypothetical protein